MSKEAAYDAADQCGDYGGNKRHKLFFTLHVSGISNLQVPESPLADIKSEILAQVVVRIPPNQWQAPFNASE
jgi:hypothetical protein